VTVSSSFANSSTILPAFGELTATSIYVIWSRLLSVGPVDYRTRTDLVSFDAGDLLVCGDCVTDLLQPALKGALCDGLGHLGHFNCFRYE
jgi:hypothetical protein